MATVVRRSLRALRSRSTAAATASRISQLPPLHSAAPGHFIEQALRAGRTWTRIPLLSYRHFCGADASRPFPDAKVSNFTTADLYDANMHNVETAELRVLQPIFQIYGRRRKFCGPVATLMVSDDNVLVHEILDTAGDGRVLVIDAGAQMRRALLGGIVAEKSLKNGWAGIVVNGCIRDVDDLNAMDVGVRALASLPTKPRKLKLGLKHVPVNIGGVLIHEGEWLYADADGILVSKSPICM